MKRYIKSSNLGSQDSDLYITQPESGKYKRLVNHKYDNRNLYEYFAHGDMMPIRIIGNIEYGIIGNRDYSLGGKRYVWLGYKLDGDDLYILPYNANSKSEAIKWLREDIKNPGTEWRLL